MHQTVYRLFVRRNATRNLIYAPTVVKVTWPHVCTEQQQGSRKDGALLLDLHYFCFPTFVNCMAAIKRLPLKCPLLNTKHLLLAEVEAFPEGLVFLPAGGWAFTTRAKHWHAFFLKKIISRESKRCDILIPLSSLPPPPLSLSLRTAYKLITSHRFCLHGWLPSWCQWRSGINYSRFVLGVCRTGCRCKQTTTQKKSNAKQFIWSSMTISQWSTITDGCAMCLDCSQTMWGDTLLYKGQVLLALLCLISCQGE